MEDVIIRSDPTRKRGVKFGFNLFLFCVLQALVGSTNSHKKLGFIIEDGCCVQFPLQSFTIMLFHYDGIVDQWQDLAWSNQSLHIVALHQTKW